MGLVPLSFLVVPLIFLPVLGFVRPPLARVPCTGGRKGGQTFGREPLVTSVPQHGGRCTLPIGPGAALLCHRSRLRPAGGAPAPRAFPRRRRRRHGRERASEDGTAAAAAAAASATPSNPQHRARRLPTFLPSEAVSCLQNPDTSSTIWLVGIIHEARPYVQLVKSVIHEIKPQVVMLELDAESTFLLPPGEACQAQNGLWWWKPPKKQPEGKATRKATKKRIRRAKTEQRKSPEDASAEASEVWTAVQEARACGARVLLGDRSDEESKRREAEADRADSKMLEELGDDSRTAERRRLERTGKGLQMLMALIERRRASGFEMPETRAIVRKHSEWHRRLGPRAFDVVVTERDEVMSHSLMALEGAHTTIAVVGSAHLDGMERILTANGWVESENILPANH